MQGGGCLCVHMCMCRHLCMWHRAMFACQLWIKAATLQQIQKGRIDFCSSLEILNGLTGKKTQKLSGNFHLVTNQKQCICSSYICKQQWSDDIWQGNAIPGLLRADYVVLFSAAMGDIGVHVIPSLCWVFVKKRELPFSASAPFGQFSYVMKDFVLLIEQPFKCFQATGSKCFCIIVLCLYPTLLVMGCDTHFCALATLSILSEQIVPVSISVFAWGVQVNTLSFPMYWLTWLCTCAIYMLAYFCNALLLLTLFTVALLLFCAP